MRKAIVLVEEFGGAPGVIGFMITSVRYQPVHSRRYAPLYRALEECGKPLGFHTAFHYYERSMEQFNRFPLVHALGFPHSSSSKEASRVLRLS